MRLFRRPPREQPPKPAERMAEVVALLAPLFRERGFRKRRHAFNREAEPGATEVVTFQMGAFQPPGTVELPDARPNLYGSFTVNLGIRFEAVAERVREAGLFDPEPKGFVAETSCHLRTRLELEGEEIWWRLDLPAEETAAGVRELLEEEGFPSLERFRDPRRLLEAWSEGEITRYAIPPPSAAVLAASIGDDPLAARILREEADPAHSSYASLTRLAETLGIDLPAPR